MKSDAYFEDIDIHIQRELRSAKKSVKACVAWINGSIYNPIFHELSQNGVEVEVIYNNDHINQKTQTNTVQGVNFYPINTRIQSALMHNKFCIIDDEIILTGSFNWSVKAPGNFENIVVIKNDYKLVKQFLHEFEDLKNYYNYINTRSLDICSICRSHIYNFGIFREETGKYSESEVQIWSICAANFHVNLISDQYEQFIQSWLWDNHEDDPYSYEEEYHKEIMLQEFLNERSEIKRIQEYFNSGHGVPIHAVGFKHLANQAQYFKWDYPAYWEIKMLWRDMFYRKIIPDVIYNGQGEIEKILYNTTY